MNVQQLPLTDEEKEKAIKLAIGSGARYNLAALGRQYGFSYGVMKRFKEEAKAEYKTKFKLPGTKEKKQSEHTHENKSNSAPTTSDPIRTDDNKRFASLSKLMPKAIGLVVGCYGVHLAYNGIKLNIHVTGSFSEVSNVKSIFENYGIAIDLGAYTLLSISIWLWQHKKHAHSLFLSVVWVICFGLSMQNAIGFMALNIGDHNAERIAIVTEKKRLAVLIASQKLELEHNQEKETPEALESMIQIERTKIPVEKLKSSKDCGDSTTTRECNTISMLRIRQSAAKSKIAKQAEMNINIDKFNKLPDYVTEDPTAERIAQATRGYVNAENSNSFRIFGMAASTLLPAFCFMIMQLLLTL